MMTVRTLMYSGGYCGSVAVDATLPRPFHLGYSRLRGGGGGDNVYELLNGTLLFLRKIKISLLFF